jgi:hypothetical protein
VTNTLAYDGTELITAVKSFGSTDRHDSSKTDPKQGWAELEKKLRSILK